MHVNRIYFRGIKTFQVGLGVFAPLLTLSGCISAPSIELQTLRVVDSPRIVDVRVLGACSDAEVTLEIDHPDGGEMIVKCVQAPENKGNSSVYQARVQLASFDANTPKLDQRLDLTIQCTEHGSRRSSHSIVDISEKQLSTPDWAKGLVWYQVFPERFRDGNPNNTPNGWDLTPKPWSSPFNTVTSEEIERGWNRSHIDPRQFGYRNNRDGGAIRSVIFARRYGGDLIGLYDQLELLKEQGYTGIYMCPIFQSRSLHKYDASDHRHIDPTLGHPGVYKDPGPGHVRLLPGEHPSDERTWKWTVSDRWFIDVFLPKAKSLGLRVVLDGVLNHVGIDHFAFADVMTNGIDSEFADWFEVEFDEDGSLLAWKSWGSINGNLPVFRQVEHGDLSPGPKAHMMAMTRRWMDPNGDGDPSDGIDGWRLDVAGEVGTAFWKDWRKVVRKTNPEALIIAEIWSDADHVMNDEVFDGQMNYPFAYAIADWLSTGESKGDAKLCARRLASVFHHEPEHDLVQFNLMTSHDTERLVSMMHNDRVRGYDQNASRWDRGDQYDATARKPGDLDRAFAAIAAMVAAPGSLMIYNGDEYAMTGADDPDNRRPIPWPMIEGAQKSVDRIDEIRFNEAVNKLLQIRGEETIKQVLRYGSVEFEGMDDGVLIIRRKLNNQIVEFRVPSASGHSNSDMAPFGTGSKSESLRKMMIDGGQLEVVVRVVEGLHEE